eukprot:TRINITY_DN26818_c0_g1_i1.p1 TRINITY_DN26818_c0_g1~~TRINITY_DN26818_c0_g1_i1.p1  ORF type:complete len:1547 (-),score=488.39 TRINITY_DN26818_c0_g1_i1:58-4698(-)
MAPFMDSGEAVPGFSVSTSVRLMLLQGQLMADAKSEPSQQLLSEAKTEAEEAVDTSLRSNETLASRELSEVLASLCSEGSDDCRVLLRRASAARQFGEGVEEELRLAEDALDLYRAEGGPACPSTPGSSSGGASSSTASPYWEATALCAVAEAHLGIEDSRAALDVAEEALALCRSSEFRLGEAEALLTILKAQILNVSSDDAKQAARELLMLLRELGASWGEVASMLDAAERSFSQAGADKAAAETLLSTAFESAATAREAESRWDLAQALCSMLRAHFTLEGRQRPLRILQELLSLVQELGAVAPQAGCESLDADSAEAKAWALCLQAESQLAVSMPAARRTAASALRVFREELRSPQAHQVQRRGEARALLTLARAALAFPAARREEEAFSASLDALTLCRQVGDRRGEAFALHVLAETCLCGKGLQGGPEAALQLASEAGRLFCDVEERRGVASLLGLLSRIHHALGAHEDAFAAARDALATFEELEGKASAIEGDPGTFALLMEKATVQMSLANAQLALGKTAEGQKTAREALYAVRGLLRFGHEREGLQERLLRLEGEALLVSVKSMIACGQLEQAVEHGTEAHERFKRAGEAALEASALQLLASAHLTKKEPSAARAAAQQALELLQELHDAAGEKDALQLVVSAELMGTDSGTAMQTAKRAVDRFKHDGDRKNEALALQTVAKTHIAKDEFLRAARVAKDAQKILGQLGDTDGEIEMLRTAVDAHLARPEAEGKEDALQAAMEALADFRRSENLRGQALGLSMLAKIYMQLQDPETAVHIVRDAVELLRELGDRKGEADLLRSTMTEDLVPAALESQDVALRTVKAALAVCHQAEDKKGQAVMLKTTFRILLAREKPERALQAAEEAAKIFRELEDCRGEGEMLLCSAQVLLSREEHRRALSAAQGAASLFREAGDRAGEMSAMQTAMDVHSSRGDHALALQASEEVLAMCRSLQDPASEAALLQRMCEVYLEQGGKENAEVVARTAQQAHSLARAAGDLGAQTAALAALAKSHLAASRPQEAVEVAKEAVRCGNDSGERRSQITALQAFGDVSLKLGHAFDALEAAGEAMEYARFEGLVVQEAAALATVVAARLANAEPSEALRSAKEAHDRAKRLGNARSEAAALQAVASVCLHIKAPAEAIQALDGAQIHYRKLKDRKKEAAIVGMVVKAQLLAGDAVQALRAAKEARTMARETRDKKAEAEALDAASQVHMAKQDYNEALDCLKSMASLSTELGDEAGIARARQLIASLYLTKGDPRAAVDAAEDAVAAFQKLGDLQSEAAMQHLCAQAYMQRHHDEEASRRERGMMRQQQVPAQDTKEAIRVALRARTLYRQLGNVASELEVLETLSRALLAKPDIVEGLRTAEEYLALAKKARDKLAEANANLLCSSALANDQKIVQALRLAEVSRSMFRDLGHAEGIKESERFLGVLNQAAKEMSAQRLSGYGGGAGEQVAPGGWRALGEDRRGATGRFGMRPAPAEEPQDERPDHNSGSLLTGQRRGQKPGPDASRLYNRRAFPWTPQQAAAVPATTPGI